MVAHTGNTTGAPLPTNNYSSPSSFSFKMNLPQNLLHPIDLWTKNDVQKWIEYCIDEYSLSAINLKDFEMNGKALLLMNEESFKQRSSRCGDILHKALQQHGAMLKSLNCQAALQYQLWNNFSLLPPTSARRFNIPLPPLPPFHPGANVLPHPSMACHPAFNYLLNRPETTVKSSAAATAAAINHRTGFTNQQPGRSREASSSSTSSSSYCPDIPPSSSLKIPTKPHHTNGIPLPVPEPISVKREAVSPGVRQQQLHRQPTPHSPANNVAIKRECTDDDEEEINVDQHEAAPTPPMTSSSPSSSPLSSSLILSKMSHRMNLHHETMPIKMRSQLISRTKQPPNDVTNTTVGNDEIDVNAGNDSSRQIRYYHDRIDFRGDILFKPPAAKNCRILWEFLFILLEDPLYESIIHWENRDKMIFRIIQADKLAALWGLQKNRLSMTYEKLSRGMRYYYSNNIISKEQSKRLLYRFMRSPDEIRKSMKRNGGTTSMVYSTINKRSSPPQMAASPTDPETNMKYDSDREDGPCDLAQVMNPPTAHIQQQLMQLLAAYPSSSSALNPAALLFATRAAATPSSSSRIAPCDIKPTPMAHMLVSKSDRSSSSSPDSFDSRDRSSDSEKQHCSPSQSLSSSSSCYSASTKRKQAVPVSLTSRLSNQLIDQPLNLAVHKDDETMLDCKKPKIITSPSTG